MENKIESLLSVKNLSIKIHKAGKIFTAVDNIDFDLMPGEITGIVGESGCGKTLTSLSLVKLLPDGITAEGEILFSRGELNAADIQKLNENQLCSLRGKEISFIFQEPFSSLNPLLKTGKQINESLVIHGGKDKKKNKEMILDLMKKTGLSDCEKLYYSYPSELSGGMCQRIMIALSMICSPQLLIADEPTTALDADTEIQIINLLKDINKNRNTAVLFISHDLGLVKNFCSRVFVMYAGKIVEKGPAEDVFNFPSHEYTKALLGCLPEKSKKGGKLFVIPGRVPRIEDERPQGCIFADRCGKADEQCRNFSEKEIFVNQNHSSLCIKTGIRDPV